MSSSNIKSVSECIYMCVLIAVCRYFLPIQCKWQIMIFFPLVNQVFSPEFTTQPFYLKQFHTDFTGFFSQSFAQFQEMLRFGKWMVSSHFGVELILSDCDLFLVGFRDLDTHTLSHSSWYPAVFLSCLLGNPSKSSFFRCQHTVRLSLTVNSWIIKKN